MADFVRQSKDTKGLAKFGDCGTDAEDGADIMVRGLVHHEERVGASPEAALVLIGAAILAAGIVAADAGEEAGLAAERISAGGGNCRMLEERLGVAFGIKVDIGRS